MRHLTTLIYSIVILSSGTPAWAQLEASIQNGVVVPASDALSRSVALVRMGGGTCSASFLTKKVLLTAGHCTVGKSVASVSVSVRNTDGQWTTVKAARVVTHPNYKIQQTAQRGTMIQNDVGIIVLSKEFPFAVRPLKISGASSLEDIVADVTVVGYGLGSKNGGSGVLRRGTMAATVEPIANFFGRKGIYMEEKAGQIVCPGDSGGAVLRGSRTSTALIGVNSISSGCQGAVGTSMSELTSQHKTWIRGIAPDVP